MESDFKDKNPLVHSNAAAGDGELRQIKSDYRAEVFSLAISDTLEIRRAASESLAMLLAGEAVQASEAVQFLFEHLGRKAIAVAG